MMACFGRKSALIGRSLFTKSNHTLTHGSSSLLLMNRVALKTANPDTCNPRLTHPLQSLALNTASNPPLTDDCIAKRLR
jgi:hypothetical protein